MENNKIKITQSLLKSLIKYRNGEECGIIFKAKYIDNRYDLFPPSDAQNLGAWFEYMATGSVPKNGETPKAEYLKRGKDENGNPQLATDYRLMKVHVDNFKKTMNAYGFEMISVGEDITTEYPNKFGADVILKGTLDIRAMATKDIYSYYQNEKVLVAKKGEDVIIDLKTTGLLDDKYNDYGWQLDNLHNKINLVTQPIHYKFIELCNTGKNIPFIFMLFNSRNENDVRIIDFRIDDSAYEEHKSFIDSGIQNMIFFMKRGFKATPSLAKCSDCPLANDCKFKASISPISVYYFANQI